jgi:hypothetical protein
MNKTWERVNQENENTKRPSHTGTSEGHIIGQPFHKKRNELPRVPFAIKSRDMWNDDLRKHGEENVDRRNILGHQNCRDLEPP